MIMADWLTFEVACDHPQIITGGRIMRIDHDGSIEWETPIYRSVVGSYDSSLRIKTTAIHKDGTGASIRVDGNPVKWIQGHNIFGTDDVIGLIYETMMRLVDLLGLTPTDFQKHAWSKGVAEISRVDLTTMYELNSRADVLAWIRSAEFSAHMKHRGKGQITGGSTLYFGKHSRRWATKFYSKGQELEAHPLPRNLEHLQVLHRYAENKLRCELTLRKMELKKRGLHLAMNWSDIMPLELHREFLQGLNMSDTHTLPATVLDGLRPALVAVYQLWKEGHDIRAMYPKKTFYRYRNALLVHGVDIAIKQPREHSNVVPLVRILEAKPASLPDWAYGSSALFEPRKMG